MRYKYQPNYAIPPAETLKEMMEEKEWSVPRLAEASTISEEVLNGILSATIPIDEQIAYQLEEGLGIPRTFWLNLECKYRETIERLEANSTKLHRDEDGTVYEID